jgi:hypothetical protein
MEVGEKESRTAAHGTSPRQEKKKKSSSSIGRCSMPQLADVSDDKRYHEGSIGDAMRKLQRASEELPQATS